MTSTITNSFRRIILDELVDSSENLYIALARSDSFVEPSNISSKKFQLQSRHGLIAVKTLSGISYVVPTIEWTSGEQYEQYNNENESQTNFYVLNSNREVFLCVEQGRINNVVQNSIIEPTAAAANFRAKTFITGDGYKWRYLYKMSNLAYSTFKTNSYMPVKRIKSIITTIPEEIDQLILQDSSISGEILGIYIDSAGTNYITTPTITITGNGTGASFTAEINAGSIVAVRVDSDTANGSFLHGSGYDFADITLSEGNASLRAIYGPREGTTFDPTVTLKANSVMFETQFEEDEVGTILTNGNNFYQVLLMKGLKKYSNDSDFIGNSGNALKILNLSSISDRTGFSNLVTTVDETVAAKFVAFDSAAGNKLYYYQDESTGFGIFEVGDTVVSGLETGVVQSIINPDVDAYSGEILYINNLSNPIDRASGQIEDVRIVIRLG